MKFYIKTFGCQMNEHDSEIIAGVLQQAGYRPCDELDAADIIVVNTCCIRESAENKIWGYIGNLKNIKYKRPGVIIAMLGCMTQQTTISAALKRYGSHIDIVLGTYQQHRLPEYITRAMIGNGQIVDISEDNRDFPDELPCVRTSGVTAQVNISYGCNNFCSYCIVPYVRGRERSRSLNAILSEIREAAAAGSKEIMLLGQNVNSYGKDLGEAGQNDAPDFATVLKAACAVPGIKRVRYMSSHPRDFSNALVDEISKLPQVRSYYHLPLQSGCDKTLKAMNRGYDTARYAAIIDHIREQTPEAAVTTDIIVGFPGETEDDFQATLDFIARCRFDAAYTFLYSPRSGTPAAKMADQVPLQVKKERLQRLTALQNQISLEKNQTYIGQIVHVLVEGPSKNNPEYLTGRTESNKIVILRGGMELVNQIVAVKITGAKTWHLEAL
ncbi:MAG TPA: tRNA (N6-isopentenyl adenosine(37)-C2)-methylthiotransferase MiaB [Candidatus Avidehalobacter gallistercoris]|uniref:tRNA-2-methylthio-N(6)-dimethylallyladenosine synthase n=1 Tax=Candidatus Avidehalobacter gallistercoris TaxID=2840694 RepID=A0A9D1KXZ5_9FIRM|nr:tRNA (N6-isopentenyl adenosine(37)-C2)-methylthiotransferase MiaB [Candidatus Avidehalobacter gallistercoris]